MVTYSATFIYTTQKLEKKFMESLEQFLENIPETHVRIRRIGPSSSYVVGLDHHWRWMALAINEVRDLATAIVDVPYEVGLEVGEDEPDDESNTVFEVVG